MTAEFLDSGEAYNDPVTCGNDVLTGHGASFIKSPAATPCKHSVTILYEFIRSQVLNCDDECYIWDWQVGGGDGSPAQFMYDMMQWGGYTPDCEPVAVPNTQEAPALSTKLIGARPNPANPSATITYSLAQKGHVSLKVFDVSGRLVRTLVSGVVEASAEPYQMVWDGKNDAGQSVGSGVFFYQLDAPGYTSAKKLVILK
jgi:hypothetical protein